MPVFHQYDPSFVDVIYGGRALTGFAETFIEIEYEDDQFKKVVGSLGDVTRTRSLNRSGKFTITLMDASESNDFLMTLATQDITSGSGQKPFRMVDRSSNTEVRANETWVKKVPKVGRAKESGNTVWEFEAAFITINVGGSIL